MPDNYNNNDNYHNDPQEILLDNMRQKIEMWREEAVNQPDRAAEMVAWADHFSEMAKHIHVEEVGSSGAKTHTPPPDALRDSGRFDNPEWMRDARPSNIPHLKPQKIALKM